MAGRPVGFGLDQGYTMYANQSIARPGLDAHKLRYSTIDAETDRRTDHQRLEGAGQRQQWPFLESLQLCIDLRRLNHRFSFVRRAG